MGAEAAIIAMKIRQIINRFLEAGAVSPEKAVTKEEIQIHNYLIFKKLTRKGVLVEAGEGRYYLNQERLALYLGNRRRILLMVLVLIILALLIFYLVQGR